MLNRQRDEVIRDVLSSIADCGHQGAGISRVMFKSYLSHAQTKVYLSMLLEKEMIEPEIGMKAYRITSKGREFLSSLEAMTEMLLSNTGVRRGRGAKALMDESF